MTEPTEIPTEEARLDPLARAARQIRPAGGGQSQAEKDQAARANRLSWLFGPFLLLVSVGTGALALSGPAGLFMWVVGAGILFLIAWVITSALSPATADRNCPDCGKDGLVRLDPETHRGLRCKLCGWHDESASSFFLAEEEGALEHVVLKERGFGGDASA